MVKITTVQDDEEQEVVPSITPQEQDATEMTPMLSHPACWCPTTQLPPPRAYNPSITHPASIHPPPRNGKRASELKIIGNNFFVAKQYQEAIDAYSEALDLAPQTDEFSYARAVFYANRAACYFEMRKFDETILDCTRCLKLDSRYLKALVRRSKAHEALENLEDALADLSEALKIDPRAGNVFREHARLEKAVKEKNEKLKDEMMGKLKDLGNTILGKFGMSLDNFKTVQDPVTGSYSVSYQS